jgi:hypothetical protein
VFSCAFYLTCHDVDCEFDFESFVCEQRTLLHAVFKNECDADISTALLNTMYLSVIRNCDVINVVKLNA